MAMTAPRLYLRTTAQIIKQSSASFLSSLYVFLFLSLLLFSFRTVVENGTLLVTSFIDRDPSLKALLSRLDLSGQNVRSPESFRSPTALTRRRRPFLHLSRVGTLEDDFFSGDDDDDRGLFGLAPPDPVNGSVVNLSHFFRSEGKLGFLDSEKGYGITFSEIVGSGFLFKAEGFSLTDDADGDGSSEMNEAAVGEKGEEGDRPTDFKLLTKGLEFGRRDAATLFFLVSFLSAAYGWVILGFLITHSCLLGVVFYAVVNDHLRKYRSFVRTIWAGSWLGIRRISGFVLMKWAVRDALTQLLGLWYFGEIEDQYSFFKLFVRLKLMPLSISSPWIRGFETEISGFLSTWFFLDVFVAFVFAVDCWVAVMDTRRSGREVIKEGCYLISTMLTHSVNLKCLEILFVSVLRWVVARFFGELFASFFQSIVEVYFMVAWLILYFAARCKVANSDGRTFGLGDLEDYISGLR
ncbi:PREDICTED: uncharacterized protein LOC104601280 [Nelumbo nucifera]|uniref:Uncharacterized protein LOC104601280 n=2 Tax=Nelumbo nucifera TaxID=4432 RepID=A0A1U8A6K5_NELNU|nr:PREDICTED: uncharacterized protein LOC104601280 [Nelumbo nucifera]DAD28509.1 TPA_asm: hypothetical protein HUJ06_029977 [Nelumbo nucifera]